MTKQSIGSPQYARLLRQLALARNDAVLTINFPPHLEKFFSFHKILLMSTYYYKLRKPESLFDKKLSKNCGKQDSKPYFFSKGLQRIGSFCRSAGVFFVLNIHFLGEFYEKT